MRLGWQTYAWTYRSAGGAAGVASQVKIVTSENPDGTVINIFV
jgi:hypothetical protein